ncbi:hypothetical protein GCM10011581_11780 [Saccharopolyspora subtropica]|uniref:ArsR family transcriptional regulator n=2 Tax=Saccharopolyspora thermophila TaxID=89367 RepID=A0A917JPC5_9PSEU|nr:hypothetical protein GCM10011581_11780 [Saccharopolyspora subtropica]
MSPAAAARRKQPEPAGLPDPLPEPAADELRLETVFAALADPLRMEVVRRLLLESEEFDHPCGWFGFDRPKSSLTHHFRALREAGLIRSASTARNAAATSASTTSTPASRACSTSSPPGTASEGCPSPSRSAKGSPD